MTRPSDPPNRFSINLALTLVSALALALAVASAGCGGGDASYGERMSREHAGDAPVAGDAAQEAERTAEPEVDDILTRRVVYATVGGTEVTGYLAQPADSTGTAAGAAGAPGLIVIHEWWGLNDNVETMARMFAHAGYAALAVDLYGGRAADDPAQARALVEDVTAHPEVALDNLRQARAFLGDELGAQRVGVIGWCFGGGWSLQTALAMPGQIGAAVIYYGRLVADRDELAKLQAPVLGLFGAEDQGIPVADVRAFETALGELGKDATIHVYEGAGHAFANPSGTRYQPEAARDAWEKTLAFLAKHLKGGGHS
jgi:carboxymethylenebutenolidase